MNGIIQISISQDIDQEPTPYAVCHSFAEAREVLRELEENDTKESTTTPKEYKEIFDELIMQINENSLLNIFGGFNKCHNCVNEIGCNIKTAFQTDCPFYKRDPPDGGFYG